MTQTPSTPFEATTDVHGDLVTVRVSGEVDVGTAAEFGSRLQQAAHLAPHVDVDLTGVDYMDSSGLRALLATKQHVDADGGRVQVCAMSPIVARLVEITGLTEVLTSGAT